MQIIFLSSTKCLSVTQYVNKFLVRHKKFELAQNILGPVKGQGINIKYWMEITFWCSTKFLGLAQNVYKFLDRHKMYINFWTGTKHFRTCTSVAQFYKL